MASNPETDTTAEEIFARAKFRSLRATQVREWFVKAALAGCAVFSILITYAIIMVLAGETLRFFGMENVSVYDFFTGLKWNPLLGSEKHFGIWPLISGTLMVTAVALLVALTLGLITAIYLSEYAPPKLRATLKPTLEVLAGIPTVVLGFFALTVITPSLRFVFGDIVSGSNVMSAGIAVGILCLPTVSSLAEDALQAVPRSLREGAYGLGATKFDVSLKIVVPAALSGIISAFLLAIARAVGETMIVALAAGNTARMTWNPLQETQTMTGFMVQMAGGDVSNYGPEYYSMYAVAATLFVMTFLLTAAGQMIRKRFREAYE